MSHWSAQRLQFLDKSQLGCRKDGGLHCTKPCTCWTPSSGTTIFYHLVGDPCKLLEAWITGFEQDNVVDRCRFIGEWDGGCSDGQPAFERLKMSLKFNRASCIS